MQRMKRESRHVSFFRPLITAATRVPLVAVFFIFAATFAGCRPFTYAMLRADPESADAVATDDGLISMVELRCSLNQRVSDTHGLYVTGVLRNSSPDTVQVNLATSIVRDSSHLYNMRWWELGDVGYLVNDTARVALVGPGSSLSFSMLFAFDFKLSGAEFRSLVKTRPVYFHPCCVLRGSGEALLVPDSVTFSY